MAGTVRKRPRLKWRQWAILIAAFAGILSLALWWGLPRFKITGFSRAQPEMVALTLSDHPLGSAKLITATPRYRRFWLLHDERGFIALRATPQHPMGLDCDVGFLGSWDGQQWRNIGEPSKAFFRDPCLGVAFELDGKALGGPALRGLDRFAVKVQGATIVVDTGTLLYSQCTYDRTLCRSPDVATDKEMEGFACRGHEEWARPRQNFVWIDQTAKQQGLRLRLIQGRFSRDRTWLVFEVDHPQPQVTPRWWPRFSFLSPFVRADFRFAQIRLHGFGTPDSQEPLLVPRVGSVGCRGLEVHVLELPPVLEPGGEAKIEFLTIPVYPGLEDIIGKTVWTGPWRFSLVPGRFVSPPPPSPTPPATPQLRWPG